MFVYCIIFVESIVGTTLKGCTDHLEVADAVGEHDELGGAHERKVHGVEEHHQVLALVAKAMTVLLYLALRILQLYHTRAYCISHLKIPTLSSNFSFSQNAD